ncbi:MAG: T9SS type A sorting domain-containing protein [bacterium]
MKRLLQNFVVLLLSIIFISSFARAVENDEAQLRKDLPKLLGSSNQGTEFFMTFHPCWEESGFPDGCKIYITSAVATRVTIEIPGREIFIQRTTLPNDVIEINLDPGQAQCYRKTDREPPQPQRVFKGYGIIVMSDDPIVCYGLTRYRYTSDGYLAIPKSGLGKNYIVSSFNDPCKDDGKQYLTSYTSIVGAYNKTEVKIKLGGRSSNYTPGAKPLKFGDIWTETLGRGDVWLIGVMGDYNDLTGTTVQANKAVSVISGSFCAYVPIQVSACDFIIEQDLPMETWGYKYHVTRIVKRLNASVIRVLASEANTTIYRDGNEWSLVKGVGGADGTGYIEKRSVSKGEELRPVTISAKNRIAVTQYNCGMSDDGVDSDPFQLALTPIEQYQTGFLWCTPGVNGGSSFRFNYLNLCYKSTSDGKIPDDIEFGKVSNGVINWRKLSTVVSNPGQEFVDPSITDLRKYRSITITLEDPAGVYSLRGAEGMTGYGYGFDWYDSYGYPVSIALADLSKPDVWAPIPTYTMNCTGEVLGRVIEQPENKEELRSNMANLRLVKGESYNFTDLVYDEANFEPGVTHIMDWALSVIDIESDAKAVLEFMDRAGNDTTITIDYQRTKFSIKNRIENWGAKKVSDPPETRSFTLINESANPVIVDSIFLLSTVKDRKWPYNGFKLDSSIYKKYGGLLPGYAIQSGESLPFEVTFNSSSVNKEYLAGKGQFLDSIGIKANWSNDAKNYCYLKYRAAVRAAIGEPCITVGRIDFGQEIAGNPLSKVFSISNNGISDLHITGYTLPAGSVTGIYETNLGVIDVANPQVIPAGISKEYNVTFKSNAVAQFPDKIVFESDADTNCQSNDPILELTGEGINLTITPFTDWYIEENTSSSIAFKINSDNTSAVKIINESDDEALIPTDSIIINRNGTDGIVKITPMQNKTGSCFLTITATNDVVSASQKFKVTVSKAGLVEDNTIAGNDITITPNPVNANFSIHSATLIIQEVMIYDVSGALVLQTDQISNIDISRFTAGVYYCVVKSNGNSYSKKFEIVK